MSSTSSAVTWTAATTSARDHLPGARHDQRFGAAVAAIAILGVGLAPGTAAASAGRARARHAAALRDHDPGRSLVRQLLRRDAAASTASARCPASCRRRPTSWAASAPHPITARSAAVTLRTGAQAQRISVDHGQMDGFVRAQARPAPTARRRWATTGPRRCRCSHELAGRGVLFDNWFSGVPGGTVAERPVRHLGSRRRSPSRASSRRGVGRTCRVIFDRLNAAGRVLAGLRAELRAGADDPDGRHQAAARRPARPRAAARVAAVPARSRAARRTSSTWTSTTATSSRAICRRCPTSCRRRRPSRRRASR